jgi:starvation-inducible DNA-binding protein
MPITLLPPTNSFGDLDKISGNCYSGIVFYSQEKGGFKMKHFEKLNEYLSNLAVLNVKLHSLHWNVEGIYFLQIHEFTEKLYNDLFTKYDDVAEILKMKDQKPLAKLSDYLKHASIQETDQNKFLANEVLEILHADFTTMRNLSTLIRNEADEVNDFEVVSMLEDHVADYSKTLWFVKTMMA